MPECVLSGGNAGGEYAEKFSERFGIRSSRFGEKKRNGFLPEGGF